MEFYDFVDEDVQGQDFPMADLKDKVVLVVNVASKCGFTPQYEGLQNLYDKYKDQGLVILGFPCNQFKNQEPGTNEEIQSFCQINYGVEFPIMTKIDVNGEDEEPLYRYLKDQRPRRDDEESIEGQAAELILEMLDGMEKKDDIIWNFEKFLVDRDGQVVVRYSSASSPEDLEETIVSYL